MADISSEHEMRQKKPATPMDAEMRTKVLAAYKQMLAQQFTGTLILVVTVTFGILFLYARSIPIPFMPLVMLAGIFGAFFSSLTRLYDVDAASAALVSPTVQHLGGRYLFMYSFVPPIVGAIASVVLYLIFVAKLLEGGLFPKIDCAGGQTCASVQDMMHYYWPKSPEDYGKGLVWGFIAGFSERLVPNLLQSLVAKQMKGGGEPTDAGGSE